MKWEVREKVKSKATLPAFPPVANMMLCSWCSITSDAVFVAINDSFDCRLLHPTWNVKLSHRQGLISHEWKWQSLSKKKQKTVGSRFSCCCFLSHMKVCCVRGWSLKASDCSNNERALEKKQTNNLFVVRISRCERVSRWLAGWASFTCIGSHHRLKWDRFLCFVFLHGDWTEKIWNSKMETESEKGERKAERKRERSEAFVI